MEAAIAKKEKLYYLDVARGIAICFVVLGHADGGDNPLNIWISTFLLPLFFIISGVLLRYRDAWKTEKIGVLILKRAKGLLIPYFGYSAICIAYYFFMRIVFREGRFLDILDMITSTIALHGYSTLWFLPTLFFAEIIVILIIKYQKRIKWCVFLLAAITFVGLYVLKYNEAHYYDWWYFPCIRILKILISAVFIMIGYLYFEYKDFLFGKLGKSKIGLSVAILIANMFLAQLNPHWIDLNFCRISYLSLYYLLATGSTVSLLMLLEEIQVRSKPFEFLGKGSLVIMGTHNTLPILQAIQKWYLGLPFAGVRYMDDLVVTALVIGVETVIILMVNNYKRHSKVIRSKVDHAKGPQKWHN